MRYKGEVLPAVFIKRQNRFVASCLLEGEEVVVHVPNTGRCKELLIEGSLCYLLKSQNPKRKTAYSLIAVEKGEKLINLDSGAPNKLVREAVLNGKLPFMDPRSLRSEVTFGKSRLDFADARGYMEVKGVTLENQGVAAFPDAVTARGARHLEELAKAVELGKEGHLVFVVQMEGIRLFTPNEKMDPHFTQTLKKVINQGVQVHVYDCKVTPSELVLNEEIPFQLGVDFYA